MKTVNSRQWTVNSVLYLALFALSGWLASCGGGGGRYCWAQSLSSSIAQSPGPSVPWSPPSGAYYAPEANLEALDAAALGSAQQSIWLAAFSLSDKAVIYALADRAAHGVAVWIYLDRGELQAECRGDASCARSPLHLLLNVQNVQIRVKRSKVLMHLKAYLVDAALERDGSANFSEQGEMRQDNSAVFSEDPHQTTLFIRKFKAIWQRPDNLTVAQAVGSP
jgi:phosphatidylserine/phosphatidylglycerophosphate/cardiolipin synthase-like enzyme